MPPALLDLVRPGLSPMRSMRDSSRGPASAGSRSIPRRTRPSSRSSPGRTSSCRRRPARGSRSSRSRRTRLRSPRGGRTYYTAPIKALVSEKFFALVEVFGAENVGMVTGDSSVNPDARIVAAPRKSSRTSRCATVRTPTSPRSSWTSSNYYGDPERGWAWQVPLLSPAPCAVRAPVGNPRRRRRDRRGPVAAHRAGNGSRDGVERPVPLHFSYARTPVHETVEELLSTGRAPVYIVHFSQARRWSALRRS